MSKYSIVIHTTTEYIVTKLDDRLLEPVAKCNNEKDAKEILKLLRLQESESE